MWSTSSGFSAFRRAMAKPACGRWARWPCRAPSITWWRARLPGARWAIRGSPSRMSTTCWPTSSAATRWTKIACISRDLPWAAGARWLALTRPDVWAAVAPVCADVFPGTEDLAPNALHVPMRFFHGDMDPVVGVESSRQWQRRLLTLESPVEYIEYPGVRHNAWDFAYRNGAIFDWFGKYRRDANPDRVRLVARDLGYAAAYWVRIDALAPGGPASLDAVRTSGGVRVQTRDVDAFTLAATAKAVTIDGFPMRLRPAEPLSFSKTARGWMQGPPPAAALQGPIVEAVNGRHIYVYGADDAPSRRYAETDRKS